MVETGALSPSGPLYLDSLSRTVCSLPANLTERRYLTNSKTTDIRACVCVCVSPSCDWTFISSRHHFLLMFPKFLWATRIMLLTSNGHNVSIRPAFAISDTTPHRWGTKRTRSLPTQPIGPHRTFGLGLRTQFYAFIHLLTNKRAMISVRRL